MQISQFFVNGVYRYFTNCVKRLENLICYGSHFCTFKTIATREMNSKPPNILVFTGNNCPKLFKKIEENVLQCLETHSYLVYHLLTSEVNKQPWIENTLLLIVSCEVIDDAVAATFENYVKHFGNILLICSKFNNSLAGNKCFVDTINGKNLIQVNFKDIAEAFVYRGKYSYSSSKNTTLCQDCNNRPVIHKIEFKNGTLITSEVYLDRDPDTTLDDCMSQKYSSQKRHLILKAILAQQFGLRAKNDDSHNAELTPGYFFTNNKYDMVRNISNLAVSTTASERLVFYHCMLRNGDSEIKLPIYYADKSNCKMLNFNQNMFFTNLTSKIYGQYLIYFPVITSTMDVAEQLSEYEGIVIITDYQVSGQGRHNNKWISPVGCAMFTLHFTLSLSSPIGKKLPILQHIASLAVVHGIRNKQMYKELDIKIKWPNDLYFDKRKIGGLIVKSTIINNLVHVNIGWGINVANERPTSCLNDVIDKFNMENSCTVPYLHVEEVIASTVSQMEHFVQDFTNTGSDNFLFYYYLYWMHNNQKVTLENLNEKGTVKGLDDYGFLIVKTDSGKELSLQPDGNRFDIMKNLIYSR